MRSISTNITLVAAAAVLLLLQFTTLVHCGESEFSEKRLHFIDHDAKFNNFLFRGNNPMVGGKFSYTEMKAAMITKAKLEANLTLPEDFYLLDISYA